jgi:hypothetical protein
MATVLTMRHFNPTRGRDIERELKIALDQAGIPSGTEDTSAPHPGT